MASSFVTVSTPSIPYHSNSPNISNRIGFGFKKSTFRINASATKWESSQVHPQADKVLIRLENLPEKSVGGVLLPKSAVKFDANLVGEVISVGEDAKSVGVGKKVMFSDFNAHEVDLGGDEVRHCFCSEGDLMAVVE